MKSPDEMLKKPESLTGISVRLLTRLKKKYDESSKGNSHQKIKLRGFSDQNRPCTLFNSLKKLLCLLQKGNTSRHLY